jgi:hypothetical protein
MKKPLPWLVLAVVICAMTVFLRLQGRLWTCACGYILLWSGDINSAGASQHVFDPYTFTHVIHGFMFIALAHLFWPRLTEAWKASIALCAEALWEMIENTGFIIQRYRADTISIGYTGDTILNSFGDLLACVIGVVVARKLGLVKTLVVTAVIEVMLAISVRDGLLLNIVMLLYPIDAVRAWQAGH